MPWQGNTDVMIDRFDVRAHLDIIPEVRTAETPNEDLSYEERQINYERYRILVQNDFFSSEYSFEHEFYAFLSFLVLSKKIAIILPFPSTRR